MHFNKPMAEAAQRNIQAVGLPQWTADEQAFAKAVQKNLDAKQEGLAIKLEGLKAPVPEPKSGGSDDIGDVSWTVPTIVVRYPSNIPDLPGHHWANAIAMATPIAHKGSTAGAKVQAMTILDLVLQPDVVAQAWDYFRTVQTKDQKYEPLLRAQDKPAIELNKAVMERFRPQMRKFYYDPTRYKTYLEQLGIAYPTVKK